VAAAVFGTSTGIFGMEAFAAGAVIAAVVMAPSRLCSVAIGLAIVGALGTELLFAVAFAI